MKNPFLCFLVVSVNGRREKAQEMQRRTGGRQPKTQLPSEHFRPETCRARATPEGSRVTAECGTHLRREA